MLMKKQIQKIGFRIVFLTILTSLMSATVFADGHDEDKDGDKEHHIKPCSGFKTFSQEKWASTSNKQATSSILATNFATVFPTGLTIGGTKKIVFTNYTAVRSFLNQSGGSKVLSSSLLTNPTKSSYSNKFAAELVAATLNIEMDLKIASFATSTQNLKDLKIGKGTFKNWTVEQLVAEANKVIGGGTSPYSLSKISKAIENINDSYSDNEHGHDSDDDEDDDHCESNLVCPIVFASTVNNVSCKGGNNGSITITNITGGKDNRYTILWSNGLKTKTLTGLTAGTYTVTITDKKGINVIKSITITEPELLVASSSILPILCNGDSAIVTISAVGGTLPYVGTGTYKVPAGSYTYTITDTNGCSTSTNVVVTEPTKLTSASSATSILCYGGNSIVTVSAEGGVAPYNGTGDFTVTAGTHTYTITDANGCKTETSITINQPTELKSSSSATTILCNGGTATISISAEGGVTPYTGTGDFVVTAGTYSYTVTDSNGCTSTTEITVSEPSKLEANANSSSILCKGGNATITVSAVGGVAPYSGTGEFVVSAGTYSYTVTDSNGCSSTTEITVTEPEQLIAQIDAASIFCNGDSALVIVSATGGTQPYVGTGSFYEKAGTFTYTVTDANGCSSTDTFTLTEPTALVLSGTMKNDNSCNTSSCSGVARVSVNGGVAPYTYAWTNATSSVDSATGLCFNTIPSVVVTDANGCSKSYTFDTVNCVVIPTPVVPTCDPLNTYTQGSNDWGTSSTSNAIGSYITTNFATVFPNGLTIGSNSRKLVLTTSSAVRSFLPSSEDGEVLPTGTLTNPGSGYDNELAGELVAAKLNVGFDNYFPAFAAPTRKLEDMFCNTGSSSYKGKTVAEIIVIADNILGGTVSSNQDKRDELNSILKKFNEFYSSNNSYIDKNYFVCELSSCDEDDDEDDDDHHRGIVETNLSNVNFNIYPNPAKYEFVVNFSSELNCVGSLKLYDLAGKLISEEPVYVNAGENFYKVDLLSKSIKASMVIVEFKYENEIKRNIVIVK